jgi:hypothetical protein
MNAILFCIFLGRYSKKFHEKDFNRFFYPVQLTKFALVFINGY